MVYITVIMGNFLADFFKILNSIPFISGQFFYFHKFIFKPFHVFKNVEKDFLYRETIRLHLHLNDWIQQQIFFLGEYEKPEIDFLYEFLNEGDVFIDIGGNIGLFSLNASKIVKSSGKVYAFEAFLPNFNQFKHHIQINRSENIQLENLAISNASGILEIFYDDKQNNFGMASSYLKDFTAKESVESIALNDYVKANNISKIDLIKIDIEGGEYNALQGMTEVLNKMKPIILLEISDFALQNADHSEAQILALLNENGYEKTKVLSKNQSSYNAVFQYIP